MEVDRIIAEIDAQIVKLQQARQLLAGTVTRDGATPKRAKVKVKATSRKLSPEGRKRISEAMKRRWATRRKSAAKGASAAK